MLPHIIKQTARGLLTAVVLLLIGFMSVQAQDYGKIRGKIVDSETGEPLIGANVKIQGTTKGGSASQDGTYNILQVASGTHTLVASYIGYHQKTIKDVQVQSDLSTTVNIELVPTTVESPELVVTAEQGNVQKDVTSSRTSRSRVEMEQTAGVETTSDFFKMTGSAVEGMVGQNEIQIGGSNVQVRDESVSNIHVRGGRGGELLFLVDGMPVTHPIYGGRSVLNLNVSDVKNMELLTGAFNAEYGRAQSGVVKINTRSGSQKFRGTVEYKNDTFDAIGNPRERHWFNANISGPLENGPIPGNMYYFVSGSANFGNGNHSLSGRTRPEYSIGPLNIVGKANNSASFNAKLNYDITQKERLSFFYNGSWSESENYSYAWKNFPDHTLTNDNENHRFAIQWRHTLNDKTFYRIGLQYLGVINQSYLDLDKIEADFLDQANNPHRSRMRPSDFWVDVGTDSMRSLIQSPQSDPATGFIDGQGWQTYWQDNFNETFTINGDITSQVHPSHMMKAGFQVDYLDLNYTEIAGGGVSLSPYGRQELEGQQFPQPLPPPPGPFKFFGNNRWVFNTNPIQGSMYIQDKFELSDLIINYGVRDDWFWVGNSVLTDEYKRVWEAATGLESDWTQIKNEISPRFGISFPISEKTVMFFSYGHFSQLPELQFYYRDPYSGGLTGNPHLSYVRTIKYEFGFTHQITPRWAIDIKSYNRNISGQTNGTGLEANLGLPVSLWENKDFSRVRGIETKLKKDYSNHYSGELTYTVQWATGFSSSAFEGYVRSRNDFPRPIRESPISQDIRHQVLLSLNIVSPERDPIEIFGWETPANWNVNILSDFQGGRPYTPYTQDPVEAQKLRMSARGPFRIGTDIKFRKSFDFAGLNTTFQIEAFNIFNVQNPNHYNFNNFTGEPSKFGDFDPATKQLVSWRDMFTRLDPRQFSNGRRVQLGIEVSW